MTTHSVLKLLTYTKRLIRAIRYDEKRDDSFDFLQIGEDDIDEYDDFV